MASSSSLEASAGERGRSSIATRGETPIRGVWLGRDNEEFSFLWAAPFDVASAMLFDLGNTLVQYGDLAAGAKGGRGSTLVDRRGTTQDLDVKPTRSLYELWDRLHLDQEDLCLCSRVEEGSRLRGAS